MPTGYTAFIEDGNITNGKDFLKLCLREFGIAMELRDEPLSVPVPVEEKLEPDNYKVNNVRAAKQDCEYWEHISLERAREMMVAEHTESVNSAKEELDDIEKNNAMYDKIRSEVEQWIPPTEEHANIKKFALNQIDISKDSSFGFDSVAYYNKVLNEPFSTDDTSVADYINKHLKRSYERLRNAEKSLQEEKDRIQSRNEFMRKFMDSLDTIKVEPEVSAAHDG